MVSFSSKWGIYKVKIVMPLSLSIYLPLTKILYIALDKANWSQPKMEKLYIYVKGVKG